MPDSVIRTTGLIAAAGTLLWCAIAAAHHWVGDVYNSSQRFIAEVEVKEFELINPHPLMFVEIIGLEEDVAVGGVSVGETWTLEMDNRRELAALGFSHETFLSGDRIRVAIDPARTTQYRENTMYLRALEHPRGGFVYVHNVRKLFPIDNSGADLSAYLNQIR